MGFPKKKPEPEPNEATPRADEDAALFHHRFARFRELGFDPDDSCALVRAVYAQGYNWHDVEKAMRRRCTRTQVLRIFL